MACHLPFLRGYQKYIQSEPAWRIAVVRARGRANMKIFDVRAFQDKDSFSGTSVCGC